MSYQLPGTLTVSTAQVPKGYIKPNDVYKPLQQVECDLSGKTLLYSAEPFAGFHPFFVLPWSIPTYANPLQAFGTSGALRASLGKLCP